MKLRLSHDARPQAMTLLVATAISVVLSYIPYVQFLTYPFEIFVTFIHESGHAIAAVLTGNSVDYLNVSPDTSGLTYIRHNGGLAVLFFYSAGYVGAMAFGALLLVLIRKRVSAPIVLLATAVLIFGMTMIFGLIKPLYTFSGLWGIPFTLFAGIAISVGLVLIARFASLRVSTFFVSFLAVQCVLNALFDLKDVLFVSSPFGPTVFNDANSMAQATGIPALFWAAFWIFLAVLILWCAMRLYVAGRDKSFQPDLPFETTD